MASIIQAIKEHIEKCPLLEGGKVNVDYIGTEMSYSIDTLPCDPVIQRYVDGGSKRQLQFAFLSKEYYDEDTRITIENSDFYQRFEDWLEEMNMANNLPALPLGKNAYQYEVLSKGYLAEIDGNKARYVIECRLLYEQEV